MLDQLVGFICSQCNIYKTIDRFTKRFYTTKNGNIRECYLKKCKDCKNAKERIKNPLSKEKRKITRASYYKNNKQKIRSKGNLYYRNNRDMILFNQKLYQENNKDKVRESKRKSEQKRAITDPSFRLRKRLSAQVRDHLKRIGSSKYGNSILKFLNYSIEELRTHLEKHFEVWMNWNNYGIYDSRSWNDDDKSTWTWSIDHIIPQYKFPYLSMEDENFKKCWALENLRPLSAKQNLLDGVNKVR